MASSNPNPLQFLFLGTGTSTGLPLTPCLTLSSPYPKHWSSMVPLLTDTPSSRSSSPASSISATTNGTHVGAYDPSGTWPKNIPCACCRSAVDPDVPEGWKNRRGNTSAVLRRKDEAGEWKNVLVDVGKTFREQAVRLFPKWGVKTVDAVLLTHGHADAYFGLDDLREWCVRQGKAIPVYLNQETYEKVCEAFPYMVDKTKASGGGDIPQLIWKIIDNEDDFEVEGINVKVLPVHHGIYFHSVPAPPVATSQSAPAELPPKKLEPEPLICLGFMFDDQIAYISDASSIPERTWDRMLSRGGKSTKSKTILPTPDDSPPRGGDDTSRGLPSPKSISDITALSLSDPTAPSSRPDLTLPILVVDALWPLQPHASHFSLAQALTTALRLRAANTYLIDSTHPTSHFMWEEICASLSDPAREEHEVREHPDAAQAEWLVKRVWEKVFGEGGEGEGLGDRWREEGGRVQPAWDGLVLEVGGEGRGVERHDLSTQGLTY
ncbi:hypothetical protein IAT38_001144 [Cryptococcus sp. DSM 104549]